MSEDYIFGSEAFDFETKTVPLVIYVDGERRQIGTATLTPDEEGLRIDSQVTDPEIARVIGAKSDILAGFAIYNTSAKPEKKEVNET